MSGPVVTDDLVTGRGRGASMRPWRDLWAIDRSSRLVTQAQSTAGKLVLVGLFLVAAQVGSVSLPYVLAAAAFAYLPRYGLWIALGAAAVGLARSAAAYLYVIEPIRVQESLPASGGKVLMVAAVGVYFIGAWAALVLVRRRPGSLLARRPVVSLLGMTALLSVLVNLPSVRGWPRLAGWAFLTIFTVYLWFFAYAVQDQRSRTPGPLAFQMGVFQPFWRSSVWPPTPTPLGKGAAFLRKHQAQTAQELAVTQLKALKLLLWALVLTALSRLLTELIEGRLGVPRTAAVYAAFLRGQPMPTLTSWASLVWATFSGALALAIWGHKIIAVARLAGFRLPRNTWRPLEARTLAEFWNRYYYYFKELLVEFFFFPTFLRVFRQHPRLRVFFATFMAAGVGNAIYHFIGDMYYVTSMGWRAAAADYVSTLFYCTLLAIGIGVSQARASAGHKPLDTWAGKLQSFFCVWGFFVCLQVFSDGTRAFPLADRVAFFLSLFGVS